MFSFMKGRGLRLPGSSSTNTQDSALGLMHLRKLYVELCCTAQPLSQKEHEDKLYMMLPLFCKVFENSPATEMIDKFGDVLQFSNHIARLFVTEVRRRASDQSTEAASCAIASYLEIQNSEEASNGWMLLTTLSLLATGGASIVNTMTMAALPSTLVKCLYLFFDLPEIQVPESPTSPEGADNKDAEVKDGLQSLTPTKKRDLLHRTVVQLLSRLCHYTQPAEELAKKDDLTLLFSAITSYCPLHNLPWRKGAAEVLTTISRHGLTQEVVEYIHNKNCLGLCVDNMQCNQELSPLEIVEMCFTVFCFLKDSSDKSHVLLDDFRTCQGYMFLTDFVLRLEAMSTEESLHSLRNLVLLISSLTSCGFQELRPSSIVYDAPFQQPGFSLPQPTGKGNSVRNLQAFQVLQTVFLKANTESLCRIVLDVLTSVYNSDVANYFILEPQNTLSQFIDRMTTKTPTIQTKILDLVEFVVFNLNFVPYKELISISLLIKSGSSVECCNKSVTSLLRLVRHSAIYKDVFREVGLLEVMVTCLHRYATLLKDNQSESHGYTYSPKAEVHIPEDQQSLAFLVMEAFTLLLHDNNANATVFRESGGARCVHNLVPYIQCRQQALAIVQQLVLSKEGDDDMGTLLGVMQSSDIRAITLKIDILQSLVYVLRESSRSRTMFRKVGGFLNLISVLVSVEECLEDPIKEPWNAVPTDQIFGLIHVVFQTLTAAMRQEPANAKFFATEIQYERLTNAVRSLGCFSKVNELTSYPENGRSTLEPSESFFSDLFNIKGDLSAIPLSLHSACKLLRCIYDVAIDAYGSKSVEMPIHSPAICRHVHDAITPLPTSPPSPRHPFSAPTTPCSAVSPVPGRTPRGSVGRLSGVGWGQGAPMPTHPTIVHPGAVLSLMDLLPSIASTCSEKIILSLQTHLTDVIQDLVKSERNQQIMCEAGLPQRLLLIGSVALSNEGHPLHMPLQHMLERLASQALEPKDLRDFLRLGNPLNCYPLEGNEDQESNDETSPTKSLDSQMSTTSISPQTPSNTNGNNTPNNHNSATGVGATALGQEVPLTRVKCLVSMTTPRDVRLATSSLTPAFVEFDMSAEGFGCLYLPSMAPQVSPAQSVVSVGMAGGSDGTISSGIGSGERLFPPQSGMSFCTWFCVDRYGTSETDMHPIRLLTIVRSVGSGDNHLACFSVGITAHDRNLVISTSEDPFPKPGSVDASDITAKHASVGIKLWIPELAQEGLWHHLAVTFNKAVMRHCSATVYVDGVQLPVRKMPYIQVNPGGSTPNPAGLTSVYAYVGTPPPLKAPSRLLWRLGPTHLFEETLQPITVTALCQLGPTYVGSFQAPRQEELSQAKVDLNAIVIPEEKIVFGLHAHALSVLTVSKIRKAFNKIDSKAVAKQLGLSGHDNATPIRILHNSAGHLTGPGRSFGAVLMGEIGVRTFCPKPVARTLANIGGSAPLLGLIAMTTDVEGLYAAVKALVCVIKNNSPAIEEMQRSHGYQILAYLLKKKKHLLNSHILHLTFSLVGTIDSGRESTVIPHHTAFEDLLCDLEIWHNAPSELQRSLFEHFHELLTDSSEAEKNRRLLRQLQMVNKLLLLLQDSSLVSGTVKAIANVLGVLLQGVPHPPALLIFGQFLASTLPSVDEKSITPQELQEWSTCESEPSLKSWKDSDSMSEDSTALVSAHTVCLRNTLLETLLRILHYANSGSISVPTCEEVQRVLGFDWLLLFLQGHLHPSTAIIALRILVAMLNNQTTVNKFREGTVGGGWLDQTEPVLHNRMKVVLGFNVGKSSKKPQTREINLEACLLPGFLMLPTLLPRHADVPEIYFLLIALALGHPPKPLPDNCQVGESSDQPKEAETATNLSTTAPMQPTRSGIDMGQLVASVAESALGSAISSALSAATLTNTITTSTTTAVTTTAASVMAATPTGMAQSAAAASSVSSSIGSSSSAMSQPGMTHVPQLVTVTANSPTPTSTVSASQPWGIFPPLIPATPPSSGDATQSNATTTITTTTNITTAATATTLTTAATPASSSAVSTTASSLSSSLLSSAQVPPPPRQTPRPTTSIFASLIESDMMEVPIPSMPNPQGSSSPAVSSSITMSATSAIRQGTETPGGVTGVSLPEGVDPSFLAALPENIRQEVLQEHLGIRNAPHPPAPTQAAPTPPSSAPGEPATSSLSQVNPEFLAALPPHIQEEVLAQERAEQQRHTLAAQSSSSSTSAPIVPAEPVDPAAFIQNLPPGLRQTVLADMDDSVLAVLPADIAAEAQALRLDRVLRHRQLMQDRLLRETGLQGRLGHGMNYYRLSVPRQTGQSWGWGGSGSNRGSSHSRQQGVFSSITQNQGRQLVDLEALTCLLVLLFVNEPKLNLVRLLRVLRNLSFHQPTRQWILQALLSIMERTKACKTPGDGKSASADTEALMPLQKMDSGSGKAYQQPSWLSISMDAALGCRASVFKVQRSSKKSSDKQGSLVCIHPQVAPMVCRHVMDALLALAKEFPYQFIPITSKKDSFKDFTGIPGLSSMSSSSASSNNERKTTLTSSQDSSEESKTSGSQGDSKASNKVELDFWDLLVRLDNTSQGRKGKVTSRPSTVPAAKEGQDPDTSNSALSKLMAMLSHPVVKRSTALTDKLLHLLSMVTSSLPDGDKDKASNLQSGVLRRPNPYLSEAVRSSANRSSSILAVAAPSCGDQSSRSQTSEDTSSSAVTPPVGSPMDTATQELPSTQTVNEEESSSSKTEPPVPEKTLVEENLLQLAVEVLTAHTCSEDGLEDATTMLMQLSRGHGTTREAVLRLLLRGAQELGQTLCRDIMKLFGEVQEYRARQVQTDTSPDDPEDTNNTTPGTSSSGASSSSTPAPQGYLSDRYNPSTSIVINAPATGAKRSGFELRLQSMGLFTGKTSNQNFLLRMLKVIIQLREVAKKAKRVADIQKLGGPNIAAAVAALETNATELMQMMSRRSTVPASSRQTDRQNSQTSQGASGAETSSAASTPSGTANTTPVTEQPPPVSSSTVTDTGEVVSTGRTPSAPAETPMEVDSVVQLPEGVGVRQLERQASSSTQSSQKQEDEDDGPQLSDLLGLEELWDTLSTCLTELSLTPDTHAVLVLQPAVEAFFLVHASDKDATKSSSSESTQPSASSSSQALHREGLTSSASDMGPISPGTPSGFFARESSVTSIVTANMPSDTQKFLTFAEKHRNVLNQILRQSTTHLSEGPFSVLVNHVRILDFDVKRRYFRQDMERGDEGMRREDMAIHVRREHVFEDSYRELHRRTPEQWKNRFYVVFEGEEGQDAGGLLREWYLIISKEIFNQMYALFRTSPGDRVTYIPNPSSHCNSNHLSYFKFVGRIIAKAIYDNKLLECYFSRSFYKHILSKPVKYTDMESEDYAFYQGLVFLLEHDVSELGYDLTFSTEIEEFGVTEARDLKPNGSNLTVTEENKHEYVNLVCQMKMTGAIRKQIDSFLEGFYDIIPKKLIGIFNEQELELLIAGLPTIDVDDLKANTEYHKYQSNSLQIQWFWRALRSFDQATRAKFVQFVTGTSKVPLQGFASLEGMNGPQKFQIHRDDRSTDRLPTAHTCFNQLDLPAYETYDKLRRMLLLAIEECTEGFGLA